MRRKGFPGFEVGELSWGRELGTPCWPAKRHRAVDGVGAGARKCLLRQLTLRCWTAPPSGHCGQLLERLLKDGLELCLPIENHVSLLYNKNFSRSHIKKL